MKSSLIDLKFKRDKQLGAIPSVFIRPLLGYLNTFNIALISEQANEENSKIVTLNVEKLLGILLPTQKNLQRILLASQKSSLTINKTTISAQLSEMITAIIPILSGIKSKLALAPSLTWLERNLDAVLRQIIYVKEDIDTLQPSITQEQADALDTQYENHTIDSLTLPVTPKTIPLSKKVEASSLRYESIATEEIDPHVALLKTTTQFTNIFTKIHETLHAQLPKVSEPNLLLETHRNIALTGSIIDILREIITYCAAPEEFPWELASNQMIVLQNTIQCIFNEYDKRFISAVKDEILGKFNEYVETLEPNLLIIQQRLELSSTGTPSSDSDGENTPVNSDAKLATLAPGPELDLNMSLVCK